MITYGNGYPISLSLIKFFSNWDKPDVVSDRALFSAAARAASLNAFGSGMPSSIMLSMLRSDACDKDWKTFLVGIACRSLFMTLVASIAFMR